MELALDREASTDSVILGRLSIGGMFECFTLERQAVAIPVGRYRVVLYPSAKFHRFVPLLLGVPTRDHIEIHMGNFCTDTDGCILVGRGVNGRALRLSVAALDALVPKIQAGLSTNDVWLTVRPAVERSLAGVVGGATPLAG